MKKRFGFNFILIVSAALIMFIVGSILLVRHNFNKITEMNIRYYLEIVKTDYLEGMDPDVIIDRHEGIEDYIRITFMDVDGNVIADSAADVLENHLDRPEFVNVGETFIRESATLSRRMMYLAYQFTDNNYVRVAIPLNSVLPFLNDFSGLSLLLASAILVIVVILNGIMVKQTMKPFQNLTKSLKDVANGNYSELLPVEKYSEINALLNEINDINKNISETIKSLNNEKQKTDFLLEHINQGVCVLDNQGNVIMANRFLRELFNFNDEAHYLKHYRFLFHDKQIDQAIEKTQKAQSGTTIVIEIGEAFYSVTVTHVDKSWRGVPGIFLSFNDVTAVKNIENLKRDFFVNASHELKSPLTSIMGSAEIIASGLIKDEANIIDLSKRIFEDSKRMNKLVFDMLTLSKYENYMPEAAYSSVNLKTIIKEVFSNLGLLAKNKKIELIDESDDIKINASHEHMTQLLGNLVENAVFYGKENGYVKVGAKSEPGKIIIEVADNGIGIPKADQNRVFERFYRVDKARSFKTGGTGLGLSIVKHLVLVYQGQIEVESKEDVGTKMSITIPVFNTSK
ncbi:MAG: ATP-binding protein [Candidatus Izemoplasmatales bacterium]|nr:ATP-binding protein [Candidatus Izemoplasmatales bacterium]